MLIIGCDFHTRYQQIAMAREETGEMIMERRLDHQGGEAHAFYRSLQDAHEPVRVGEWGREWGQTGRFLFSKNPL